MIRGTARATSALLLTLAAAPATGTAQAADHPCRAEVDARLAGLSIPAKDIKRIDFIKRNTYGANAPRLLGYEAWVKLESCPGGSLMLYMSPLCSPRGGTTTGSCRVQGIGD